MLTALSRGKIYLVRVDAPEPTFVGPTAVYALAFAPGTDVATWARREVPAQHRTAPAALAAAAQAAHDELVSRLPAAYDHLGTLATESAFAAVDTFGLRPLLVPPAVAPADWQRAEARARELENQHRQLLESAWPQIPWRDTNPQAHAAAIDTLPAARTLYDATDERLAPVWAKATRRKRLLLHVCCGPDAAGVIAQLKRDYDVVGFWYDPNIQPREEYDRRLEAFRQVARIENIPCLEGEYDVERFLESIAGLEATPEQGAKCSRCYDLRLERAAVEAKAQDCDLYTTTLAISPHKVQRKLADFGALNEQKYGVPYLARNFVKHEGFNDSVAYSNAHGIYRQDYCGCWFSMYEGGPHARHAAERLGLTHAEIERNSKTLSNATLESRLAEAQTQDTIPFGATEGATRSFG